jgi:hypothetical protein
MYEKTIDDHEPAVYRLAPELTLDAQDVATLSALMSELREMTQSRRSFAAASAFLRRFGAESEGPRLVPAEALEP